MKHIQYFVGKVCTIFTGPINRDYKSENPGTYPEQLLNYFLGIVEAADGEEVLITQITTGLKTLFFTKQIIGISEEQVLDPENSKDQQIISQFQAIPKVNTPKGSSPFLDVKHLEEINSKMKVPVAS